MTGGGLTGLDILPDRLSATEWPLIEALLKEGREVTVLHSGITDKHTHTHTHTRRHATARSPWTAVGHQRNRDITKQSPLSFVNTTDCEKISAGTAKPTRKQKMYPSYLRVQPRAPPSARKVVAGQKVMRRNRFHAWRTLITLDLPS